MSSDDCSGESSSTAASTKGRHVIDTFGARRYFPGTASSSGSASASLSPRKTVRRQASIEALSSGNCKHNRNDVMTEVTTVSWWFTSPALIRSNIVISCAECLISMCQADKCFPVHNFGRTPSSWCLTHCCNMGGTTGAVGW